MTADEFQENTFTYNRIKLMAEYEEAIVRWLSIYPTITAAQISDWLKESPDMSASQIEDWLK